jgi:putative transposase
VVNALGMAIRQRRVKKGFVVHLDYGVRFTPWSLTERIRDAGLMPSFGSVGDAFDNAIMEYFWSSMQNELLNRKKWKTRLELTDAIFDYVEAFHNRQRRHSSLGYVSPVDGELSMKEEKTA